MGAVALRRKRLPRDRLRQPRQIAGAAGLEFIGRTPLQMKRDDDPFIRIDVADEDRTFGFGAVAAGKRDLLPIMPVVRPVSFSGATASGYRILGIVDGAKRNRPDEVRGRRHLRQARHALEDRWLTGNCSTSWAGSVQAARHSRRTRLVVAVPVLSHAARP